MSNAPVTTLLIGNPGVGKSTILNCLLGTVAFKSGVSLGGGLTNSLQVYTEDDGNKYMDTPGLSDVKMRDQAAKEIEKGLKSGGIFKVFFVITLESGRVRADDKATIKLVLDATPQINSNYSIIINKLPTSLFNKAMMDQDIGTSLLATINEGLPGTTSIFYKLYSETLDAEDNEIIKLDSDFLEFVQQAPTTQIHSNNVSPIQFNQLEKTMEKFAKQLEEIKKDNAKLREKAAKQEERVQKERELDILRQRKQERFSKEARVQEEESKHIQQYYREELDGILSKLPHDSKFRETIEKCNNSARSLLKEECDKQRERMRIRQSDSLHQMEKSNSGCGLQ